MAIDVNILNNCRNVAIEEMIHSWRPEISILSQKLSISEIEIEKQIRLHLGVVPLDTLEKGFIKKPIIKAVLFVLNSYNPTYRNYLRLCGGEQLVNVKSKICGEKILSENGSIFDIEFSTVPTDIGQFIERELHYLRNPQFNCSFRYGMYLENMQLPIAYMSLGYNDRWYKHIALEKVLGIKIFPEEIAILSRVYGFGHLPKNAISKLMTYCEKQLPAQIKYIITAINPHLTFKGSSMLGAGFTPFAYCPVAYNYDENGIYTTRRNRSDNWGEINSMPKNILLFKDLYTPNNKKEKHELIEVSEKLFNNKDNWHVDRLAVLRSKLENAWSNLTKHHGTPRSINDPISKGQCGVTTAYLAKLYEKEGENVTFCEGFVTFPDKSHSILNHCWLKMNDFDSSKKSQNIIIDLTCDQNGFNESIICDPEENLLQRGIIYTCEKQYHSSEINNNDLKKRLRELQNILKRNS